MAGGLLNRSFLLAYGDEALESSITGLSPLSAIASLVSSRLTRRQFLGASTLTASVLFRRSAIRAERTLRRVAFLIGGEERWIVDCEYFGGKPALKFDESASSINLELSNARFPGPKIPADFTCVLYKTSRFWETQLAFRWGQWHWEGDFGDWLLGSFPAKSKWKCGEDLIVVDHTATLLGAGTGEAEFFPEWKFVLSGDPI